MKRRKQIPQVPKKDYTFKFYWPEAYAHLDVMATVLKGTPTYESLYELHWALLVSCN